MKIPFEVLKIEQRSDDWLALRKTKITSSDAAIIIGVSPYMTPHMLYEKKMSTQDKPHYVSEAMRRGTELEPHALEKYCQVTGIDMMPAVVLSKESPFLMTSLDGISMDLDVGVEIKCPGEKVYAQVKSGVIPALHAVQIQFHMLVTGFKSFGYICYRSDDEYVISVIERDEEMIDTIKEACERFYDCMQNGTPPEDPSSYVERDDEKWLFLTEQYRLLEKEEAELMEQVRNFKSAKADLREQMIELCDGINCRGNGVALRKVERKGSLNTDRIIDEYKIDKDKYRNESIIYWSVRCVEETCVEDRGREDDVCADTHTQNI